MVRKGSGLTAVLGSVVIGAALATPAKSDEFATVESLDAFVSLIDGRELKRFGITVTVTPQGQIQGRAFGYDVEGEWQWNDGYFCRDLFWGGDDLGYNCQLVEVDGETMRFTSDQGTGQSADLRMN